jgi:hypothetical protein
MEVPFFPHGAFSTTVAGLARLAQRSLLLDACLYF